MGTKQKNQIQGRHNWLTNNVVNDWNMLGRHVVSAEPIGSFKRKLDESVDKDDRSENKNYDIHEAVR